MSHNFEVGQASNQAITVDRTDAELWTGGQIPASAPLQARGQYDTRATLDQSHNTSLPASLGPATPTVPDDTHPVRGAEFPSERTMRPQATPKALGGLPSWSPAVTPTSCRTAPTTTNNHRPTTVCPSGKTNGSEPF